MRLMVYPFFLHSFLDRLATLYAQSRPVMLSRRCITATAGTSLVRDSLTETNQPSVSRVDFTKYFVKIILTGMLVQTFVH